MKPPLIITLLFILSHAVHAVGNIVVNDIAVLEKAGFSFKKSDFRSTEKTLTLVVLIPPKYLFDKMGSKPFESAAYIKPEDISATGPRLIASNGVRFTLFCTEEGTKRSLMISVSARETTGSYLEFTFNQGSGYPPMLIHVPLKAMIDSLTNKEVHNKSNEASAK